MKPESSPERAGRGPWPEERSPFLLIAIAVKPGPARDEPDSEHQAGSITTAHRSFHFPLTVPVSGRC